VLFGLLFVLLGGTIFDAQEVVGIHATNRVAPQTLLCLFCLALVTGRRRALAGSLFSVLVSIGIGSRMMRIVLPGAVFVPFALFALAGYMTRSNAIPLSYAYALAAGAGSFILLCLVVWMAWRINAMERELRDLSLTDELTGVNNRRGFYLLARQVERDAARSGEEIAVIYFDMDGLKETNDRLGHDAGSQMIRDFTAVLTANLREGDVIGRLGGDEFAVVTASCGSGVEEILARMQEKVAAANAASARMNPIRFSAGYACRSAANRASLDDLVAHADEEMYRNKEATRTRSAGLTVAEAESGAVA
jgi:diguanylate cyclase (GGDEF)-like protein